MKGFSGFPQKGRLIRIPALFFSELLPQIDSLAELKVTLACFHRLQLKEDNQPFIRTSELSGDAAFMSGLAAREDAREDALLDGLERAVARGTLLAVQVEGEGWSETIFFVNAARGRAAVEAIEKGEWAPDIDAGPVGLAVERPNLFTLYEQNIGPLTPLIADSLRDLENDYPVEWIREAIQIAVRQNARSLSYVEAILRRWETEGRDEAGSDLPDGRRFQSGKYGDEIEH